MSRSQFQSKRFILRHAWLNLWDSECSDPSIDGLLATIATDDDTSASESESAAGSLILLTDTTDDDGSLIELNDTTDDDSSDSSAA